MKTHKILKISLSLAMASPCALPLLCCTVNNNPNNFSSSLNQNNVNDYFYEWHKIPGGQENKDTWEIQFNPSDLTCKIIGGWEQSTDIDVIQVPAFITPSGSTTQYKLTDVAPTKFTLPQAHTIWRLDFSQAKNVKNIGGFAKSATGNGKLHIMSVNFVGATNLQEILPNAFNHQYFNRGKVNSKFSQEPDKQIHDMDFSGTKLSKIGSNAFVACCENKDASTRNFRKLIFPRSLQTLEHDAFGDTTYNIRFENIVFSTPVDDIEDKLFGDSDTTLPELINASTSPIYWPSKAQQEKAITMPHAISNKRHISAQSHLSSAISYSPGSTTLSGLPSKDGNGDRWSFNCGAGKWRCSAELTDSFNGQIFLEWKDMGPFDHPDLVIKWKNTLPIGQYKFNIKIHTGSYDLVISDDIVLNIYDIDMDGGDPYVYASYGDTDVYTKNFWQIIGRVNEETIFPTNIKKVDFSVEELIPFPGKIEAVPTRPNDATYQCWIKWTINESVTTGETYPINLVAKVTFEDSSSVIVKKQQNFIINNYGFDVALLDKNDNEISTLTGLNLTSSTTEQTEDIKIKITSQEQIDDETFKQIKATISSSYNTDGEAIFIDTENAQLSDDKTIITFNVTIKYGGSNPQAEDTLRPGVYNFYVYAIFKPDTYTIPLWSQTIPLRVHSNQTLINQFSLSGGSQNLYTYKKTVGYDAHEWTLNLPDQYEMQTFSIIPAPWTPGTEYARVKSITFRENTESNGKKYSIRWNEKFCTNSNYLDIFDCNLMLILQNSTTNEQVFYTQPLTFYSFNRSRIKTNTTKFISATQTQAGQSNRPWLLEVNSDSSVNKYETDFSINYEKSTLTNQQLWLEYTDDSKTQVILKWSGTIPKGYYPFTVIGYSDTLFTQAESDTYFLCVENKIEMSGFPEAIITSTGKKGNSNRPISTFVNDTKVDNATYSLIEPPAGVFIDPKTGVIGWDGSTIVGTHTIVVQSSVDLTEGDTSTTFITIPMLVEGDPQSPLTDKTNLILILSGTIAGCVGLGVGGTLISKKIHKNLKKKKSHK